MTTTANIPKMDLCHKLWMLKQIRGLKLLKSKTVFIFWYFYILNTKIKVNIWYKNVLYFKFYDVVLHQFKTL